MKSLIKKSRYWILVYGKSKNFENTVICMKLSTLASSLILYVCSLERNAGKVYYNFYQTFLLMYFVSSVILQCVSVNYSIQSFKTTNVSVCVCCGLILSLVQFFCLFVCFWVWQCITMNLKQKKIKFKPRKNLNHNIYKNTLPRAKCFAQYIRTRFCIRSRTRERPLL